MSISRKLKGKSKEIIAHAEENLRRFANNRLAVDRLWFKSILFYRGEQWIRFDAARARFTKINYRKVVPKPTTNKFKPALASIISTLVRFDPKATFAPQTGNKDDIVAAQTATQVLSVVEHEVNWLKRRTELVPWLVLTGNAFIVSGFDENAGPRAIRMKVECPVCSFKTLVDQVDLHTLCPDCREEGEQRELQPVRTAKGEEVTVEEPTGKLAVDVASPFQMFFDYRIADLKDQHTIIRIQPKDINWLKTMYPKQADQIETHRRDELSSHLTDALATLAYPSRQSDMDETTVDVVEVWHPPSEQWPAGYYLKFIGEGTALELIDYPWIDVRREAYYPITHFVFDKLPGSALGTTPAFDLIEKQWTRNRIESIMESVALHMANPVWLRPVPGTMSELTGSVAQVIDWDPNQSNNQPPVRVPGVDYPASLNVMMQQIDKDIDDITAQYEVQRGERPLSVRTASAIQQLQQLSSDRNMGVLINYSIGISEWQQQILEIFRTVMPPDRYYRIIGEQASWTVSKLQQADIRGGVDVIPEPSSVLPKTHTEQAALLELFLQTGLLQIQDPVQIMKVFDHFGMAKFLPGLSEDDSFIAREHDGWKDSEDGQIAVSALDNHVLHMARHLALFKSEAFNSFSDAHRESFIRHIHEHQSAIVEARFAVAGQPAADAQPPPE